MSKAQDTLPTTAVASSDLLAAWVVLENLAVSLDQIGGAFGIPRGAAASSGSGSVEARAAGDALQSYFTQTLVQAIADARDRLARYVPDEQAEATSEQIQYWDYSTLSRDGYDRSIERLRS